MVGIKYGVSFRLLPFKLFEESHIIANGIRDDERTTFRNPPPLHWM